MNLARALQHLLSAVAHARYACQRTRRMVEAAIAYYLALTAIEAAR